MTTYSTTASPIRSEADLQAAIDAGARFEVTGTGDAYNLPADGLKGSGGWVTADEWEDPVETARSFIEDGRYGLRARAFYPVVADPGPASENTDRLPFEIGQRVRDSGNGVEGVIVGIDDDSGSAGLLVDVGLEYGQFPSGAPFSVTRGTLGNSDGPWSLLWFGNNAEIVGDKPRPEAEPASENTDCPKWNPDWAKAQDAVARQGAPGLAALFGEMAATAGDDTEDAPQFRILVTIEADTREGYEAALAALSDGWQA